MSRQEVKSDRELARCSQISLQTKFLSDIRIPHPTDEKVVGRILIYTFFEIYPDTYKHFGEGLKHERCKLLPFGEVLGSIDGEDITHRVFALKREDGKPEGDPKFVGLASIPGARGRAWEGDITFIPLPIKSE
jgi:hypothetical protein